MHLPGACGCAQRAPSVYGLLTVFNMQLANPKHARIPPVSALAKGSGNTHCGLSLLQMCFWASRLIQWILAITLRICTSEMTDVQKECLDPA
jgi:hypothetical protein